MKSLYNTHNNEISSVYRIKNNSSTLSCEDQNVVSDKIIHSYNCTTSYTIYLVYFQGIKSSIGIDFSTYYFRASYNVQNVSTYLVIGGINTIFLSITFNLYYTSVKKCSISIFLRIKLFLMHKPNVNFSNKLLKNILFIKLLHINFIFIIVLK